mmetsp:Transcript_27522/g.107789  ORF Transcript_27522/g.107789 Transcript_27522/m.107789 type:complete len:887 (-) Transcript_27522:2168-4828(-)
MDESDGIQLNLSVLDDDEGSTKKTNRTASTKNMTWSDKRKALYERKRRRKGSSRTPIKAVAEGTNEFSSGTRTAMQDRRRDIHSKVERTPNFVPVAVPSKPSAQSAERKREPLWRVLQRESRERAATIDASEQTEEQEQPNVHGSGGSVARESADHFGPLGASEQADEKEQLVHTSGETAAPESRKRLLEADENSKPREENDGASLDDGTSSGSQDIEDSVDSGGDDGESPESDSAQDSSSSVDSGDDMVESLAQHEGTAKQVNELESDDEEEGRASDPKTPSKEGQMLDSSEESALSEEIEAPGEYDSDASDSAGSVDGSEDAGPSTTDDGEQENNRSLFDGVDFDDLRLSPTLKRHVELRMLLKKPTKVQVAAINALVSTNGNSRDGLIRSQTGSGKTLAFLLPIAHSLLERRKKVDRAEGTLAVILEPTRELAAQVEQVAQKLFRPWHWIVVGAVMGGEKKKAEKSRLRKGVTILITTPGRMVDHLRSTASLKLANCEWLILDEADRLLDLGFGPAIRETIETLDKRAKDVQEVEAESSNANRKFRKPRQNVLLSATLTKEVTKLADISLQDPVKIVLGGDEEKFDTPENLVQHYCVVEQKFRLITLIAVLRLRAKANPSMKAVVFFSSCDAVDYYHRLLQTVNFPQELMSEEDLRTEDDHDDRSRAKIFKSSMCWIPLYRLHGSMSQLDRISTFRQFSSATGGILFCTDVAARGLDLSNLGLSVQFDPPTHDEDVEYLHRAGRTARMGSKGHALLFVLPEEEPFIAHLKSEKGYQMQDIAANTAVAALKVGKVRDSERESRYVTSVLQSALQGAVEVCLCYQTSSQFGLNVVKEFPPSRDVAFDGWLIVCCPIYNRVTRSSRLWPRLDIDPTFVPTPHTAIL